MINLFAPQLSPSVERWSSPTALQFQRHAEAARATNTQQAR